MMLILYRVEEPLNTLMDSTCRSVDILKECIELTYVSISWLWFHVYMAWLLNIVACFKLTRQSSCWPSSERHPPARTWYSYFHIGRQYFTLRRSFKNGTWKHNSGQGDPWARTWLASTRGTFCCQLIPTESQTRSSAGSWNVATWPKPRWAAPRTERQTQIPCAQDCAEEVAFQWRWRERDL